MSLRLMWNQALSMKSGSHHFAVQRQRSSQSSCWQAVLVDCDSAFLRGQQSKAPGFAGGALRINWKTVSRKLNWR